MLVVSDMAKIQPGSAATHLESLTDTGCEICCVADQARDCCDPRQMMQAINDTHLR